MTEITETAGAYPTPDDYGPWAAGYFEVATQFEPDVFRQALDTARTLREWAYSSLAEEAARASWSPEDTDRQVASRLTSVTTNAGRSAAFAEEIGLTQEAVGLLENVEKAYRLHEREKRAVDLLEQLGFSTDGLTREQILEAGPSAANAVQARRSLESALGQIAEILDAPDTDEA